MNVEGTHFNDIVQAGFGRCRSFTIPLCNDTNQIVWSWGRHNSTSGCQGWNNVAPVPLLIQASNGTDRTFKVFHYLNQWRVYLDNVDVKGVAESGICWTPTSASWFGESWDYGDAIGGSVTNKLRFRYVAYANCENCGFVSAGLSDPCNVNIPAGYPYYCDVIDGTTFDVWTNR